MKNKNTNSKLGKGLGALLGSSNISNEIINNTKATGQNSQSTLNKEVPTANPSLVDINSLVANKDQPRKIFKEQDIIELSKSIKENGIIQPIIVRQTDESKKLEIIAGERRYRAAKLAKLERVPVVIKRATKKDTLVMAIIENVQRADLNCVEEALAYFQLMEEFKLTQEEVAKKIGKERSTIANFLRILKLPREIIALIQKDQLSFGHAKVLASVKDEVFAKRLANEAVTENWSVRELEKQSKARKVSAKATKTDTKFQDENLGFLKKKLEEKTGFHFAMKSKTNGKGSITINFNNEAELNDIFEYLMK